MVVLRDQFNDWIPRLTGRAGDFEALVFSLVVIVLLQRAPEGLLPLMARLRREKPVAHPEEVDDVTPASVAACVPPGAELLAVEAVTRNFGGLAAVRDVSFAVCANEIVALIGPNGAGKTTLFNVISGVMAPSAGTVRLFGAPSVHLRPHRIAALGVARSFQHVRLLGRRSVLENIALGAHLTGRAGLLRSMLRLDRAEESALLEQARLQAKRLGLGGLLDRRLAICHSANSAWSR